jgi:hypothetical protein
VNLETLKCPKHPEAYDFSDDVPPKLYLKSVNISKCPKLNSLDLFKMTLLNEVDVSNNQELRLIGVVGCENLKKLDVNKNLELENLRVSGTAISELDLSNCKKLRKFFGRKTNLKELDVSKTPFKEKDYVEYKKEHYGQPTSQNYGKD